MLRRLGEDMKVKSYIDTASRTVFINKKLSEAIRRAVAKESKQASAAIHSVVQTRHTLIIRATSRAAASDLYTVRDVILKAAANAGASTVRFTV